MKKKKISPSDQLLAEKRRVRRLCREQEQVLNEDLVYAQEHAGSLLWSGISWLFFSTRREEKRTEGIPEEESHNPGMGGFFRDMLPALMEVVQPLILTWLTRKVGSWITGFVSGK